MASLKTNNCPIKGCDGTMKWKSLDFYTCDKCGGEFWPAEPKVPRTTVRDGSNSYVSLSLQPGTKIIGGGSKSGKRKKKKPSRTGMYFDQV